MKRLILSACMFLFASAAFAQNPGTGFPPYGSFAKDRFDAINRQNLNVHFAIPIVSIPGRGMDFNFALNYDSLVWQQSANMWFQAFNMGGCASPKLCPPLKSTA